MVYDIERPDVNGVRPTMEKLLPLFDNPDDSLIPYYRVRADDNLVSSIWVKGSFDLSTTWVNGIYQNSRHFSFSVYTAKNKRYYCDGESTTIELPTYSHKISKLEGFKKFRKYTGSPEKCAAKLKDWLIYTAGLINS